MQLSLFLLFILLLDIKEQVAQNPVSARCRQLMNRIVRPQTAVRYVEALGKRNLLWDLLLDALEPNVLEVRHAE